MSAAARQHRSLAAASIFAAAALAIVGAAGSASSSKADKEPPSPPTNVRVTSATASSVAVAWDPATDNTAVRAYEVSGELRRTQVKGTEYAADRLACGDSLSIWIAAIDRSGNRSVPTEATVSTSACPDTTPPTAPSGFRQSATSQNAVVLVWDPSSDDIGVVGYGVYQGGVPHTSTSEPAVTLSSLSCGSIYEVPVDAFDAAGNRSQRRTAWVETEACSAPPPPPPGDTTPPSQPSSLTVSASAQTSVTLAWSASSDNVGVAGYGVYRNNTLASSVTQPGATVSGLACGTAYTFAVDAYDAAGNRSSRASVTGTTAACPDAQAPTAPSNLQATSRTATSIALLWSASSDNIGVAGYGLYRGGVLVGTSATTSGIFASLTCNTNFTLSVDAYDAAGNRSSKTTVMVATTACPDTSPPSAPTGLTVSNVSQTSLTLSWSASSDNVGVGGYDVYRQGSKVGQTASTSYTFGSLACGTSHTLGVVAYDAAGNRSSQASATASTSSCTAPPPRSDASYPASYYTGPLGTRNPLPLRKGAFLLTWPGSIGCEWACIKAQVAEREQAMGRRFDGIGNAWRPHESERVEQWIHDRGSLPIITWNTGTSADSVISGASDGIIRDFANYLKAYDFIVMVRLFHEFDLSHTAYHACGDKFIAMWRHVVDVFEREGVTNVGFWWSPTEGTGRACIESSYPGDTYVDWVGTDGYNFCYVGESSCWVTPMHSGWAEFSELFDYPSGPGYQSYHSLYGPRKPFVVGETATTYDPNNPSKKGQWYRNVVQAAKDMEHLTGIMVFDSNVQAAEGSKTNWLMNYPSSNADAYAGFIEMARDPYFNTR